MNTKKVVVAVSVAVAALIVGGSYIVINAIDSGVTVKSAAAGASIRKAAEAPVDRDSANADAAAKATGGKQVGDELTAAQAAALRKNVEGTQIAYPTTDGKFILVDSAQPLPETVKADAGKKVTSASETAKATGDYFNEAVSKERNTLVSETGHVIITVAHVFTYVGDGESQGWTWISSALGGQSQFQDAASALAASQSWVDSQPNSSYEIVVSQ